MKHISKLTFAAAFLLIGMAALAQTSTEPKPYIEITGTSELKIDPNQIFISIILEENTDKSKKDISDQEQNLIKALQSVGIAKENLVVTDVNAHYGKSGFMSKDVVNRKQFELEVKDATEAKKAFEQMDKLNIKNAYISRVDHTEIEEYKKQAKIKAIKAAKDKATYLLEAVGEELGRALIVTENSFNVYGNQIRGMANFKFDEYKTDKDRVDDVQIDFKKITISASIYTKWRIGS
jgi:uncharacterized protein YggE